MNDHNARCHIDINFVYIYIFIDIVSLKVICRKQNVLKLVERVRNCLCIYFVSNLGHFIIKFWAGTSEKHVCVFSKCLGKLCLSTPKNAKHVGNSDRNETCQCAERMSCVFPLTTCEMTLSLSVERV